MIKYSDASSLTGFSTEDLKIAVKYGLLKYVPRVGFDSKELDAVKLNGKKFAASVDYHRELNTKDAASLLGLKDASFKKLAQQHGVQPVEIRSWRWGNYPVYKKGTVLKVLKEPAQSMLEDRARRSREAAERKVLEKERNTRWFEKQSSSSLTVDDSLLLMVACLKYSSFSPDSDFYRQVFSKVSSDKKVSSWLKRLVKSNVTGGAAKYWALGRLKHWESLGVLDSLVVLDAFGLPDSLTSGSRFLDKGSLVDVVAKNFKGFGSPDVLGVSDIVSKKSLSLVLGLPEVLLSEVFPDGVCLGDLLVLVSSKPTWLLSEDSLQRFLDVQRTGGGRKIVLRRDSEFSLDKVTLHVGPTNSGKTFMGLEAMLEHGSGTYAGPLRMLAYEVYAKLVERVGADNVGLITGEEQVNVSAPFVACTVEAAPLFGDFLLLDESHWLSDRDRGHAWTRLLLNGRYRQMYVTADERSKKMVLNLVSDASCVEVLKHERFTSLKFVGGVDVKNVKPGTAVVGFSRKSVLALSEVFKRRGLKTAVLYGNLPPEVRRSEVRRFVSGEAQVLCCTDVIGHGINLPIETVLFAETSKFDGESRRILKNWEVGQIAGRAGRRGFSSAGFAGFLTGLPWAVVSQGRVREGVLVASGSSLSDWALDKAFVKPSLKDLGVWHHSQLVDALNNWFLTFSSDAVSLKVQVSPVTEAVFRYGVLKDAGFLNLLSLDDLWFVLNAPFATQDAVLMSVRLLSGVAKSVKSWVRKIDSFIDPGSLESLEFAAKLAKDLRYQVSYSDIGGGSMAVAADLELRVSNEILDVLKTFKSSFGVCESCGGHAAPWFSQCEECFENNFYW